MLKQISAALLLSSALAVASTGHATVANGDFEQWTNSTPDDWTTIDSGISLAASSSVVYSGNQSAAITVNTGTQSSTDLRQTVSVTSGTHYDFSAWIYHTEGHVQARLYVADYQGYSDNSLTDQWQQLSYSYTATSTGSIEVGLRFYDQSGFDGSELVYVDDFEPTTDSATDTGADSGNTGSSGSCVTTDVNITTDNYGSETSWYILNASGTEVASGGNYDNNSSNTETFCLDTGNYTFTILDSYGDGICCSYGNGSFAVVVAGTEVVSGDQFTSSQSNSVTVADSSDGSSGGTETGGGSSGGTGATDSGASCTAGTLSLTTDNYGAETSWAISNSSGTDIANGNGYSSNTSYSEDICLEDDDYTFTINDSYGDGMCCSFGNGSYDLVLDGTSVASGSEFASSESTSFILGSATDTGAGTDTGTGTGSTDLIGYYASANGLSGYVLKTELHNIISAGHSAQGYSALWTFYSNYERDNYYEADGSLLDIYSENPNGSDPYTYTSSSDQCGSYSGEGSCYNREHTFPRSWFGGAIEPMNSDVHHIYASDGYVNGKRSSYPYGEVATASYTSSNGSKLGSAESGLGYSGTVFEPIDEFKGDLARTYFYMATRYEDVISGWETQSSYGDAVLNGSSDQVFEIWYLNLMKSWHNADPVSQKELDRNDAAYSHQGNRNPFIDHPELVAEIWSN